MNKTRISPVIQVLVAAFLSGLSVPLSRLLLQEIDPVLMSSLLYLGSAVGLTLLIFLRRISHYQHKPDSRLKRADLPWLSGSIITGGVIAPILLMSSLSHTPSATASLLLNFESVATALIAVAFFKEMVGRRVFWAVAFITAGSIFLLLNTGEGWGVSAGALGIIGTTVLWGLDNNLTRKISARDPLVIGSIKGLVSGLISLGLALILHNTMPGVFVIIGALALGAVSYGIALALFIVAMRSLGAVRTSALFGTAPFWGTLLSFIIFREIQWVIFISLPFMAAGTVILLGEKDEPE